MERIVRIGSLTMVLLAWIFTASAEESLTITTYYPSPQGSYQKLKADAIGVGDTNKDGSSNLNDVPDPGTYPGQLVVANRLGVGVQQVLGRPLFVAGNTSVHTAAFLNNVTGVGVALGAYNATATTFASVQANSFTLATQGGTGVLNLSLNPDGGNVGINNTTPQADLTVGSRTNPATTGTATRFVLTPPYHTGGPWTFDIRDNTTHSMMDVAYGTNNVLTLRNDGNVGINNTDPQYVLDVVGGFRTTGSQSKIVEYVANNCASGTCSATCPSGKKIILAVFSHGMGAATNYNFVGSGWTCGTAVTWMGSCLGSTSCSNTAGCSSSGMYIQCE